MLDYEFRIALLEKELEHMRAIQQISLQRQDTTDLRLDRITEILMRTGEKLEMLTEHVSAIATVTQNLDAKFERLIEAMLHQHGNGKTEID